MHFAIIKSIITHYPMFQYPYPSKYPFKSGKTYPMTCLSFCNVAYFDFCDNVCVQKIHKRRWSVIRVIVSNEYREWINKCV